MSTPEPSSSNFTAAMHALVIIVVIASAVILRIDHDLDPTTTAAILAAGIGFGAGKAMGRFP